jgi:hypothetical protein
VHTANRSCLMPIIEADWDLPPAQPNGYHGSRGDVLLEKCLKPPSLLQHEMLPMSQKGQSRPSCAASTTSTLPVRDHEADIAGFGSLYSITSTARADRVGAPQGSVFCDLLRNFDAQYCNFIFRDCLLSTGRCRQNRAPLPHPLSSQNDEHPLAR